LGDRNLLKNIFNDLNGISYNLMQCMFYEVLDFAVFIQEFWILNAGD
jgi:hypothetical protein